MSKIVLALFNLTCNYPRVRRVRTFLGNKHMSDVVRFPRYVPGEAGRGEPLQQLDASLAAVKSAILRGDTAMKRVYLLQLLDEGGEAQYLLGSRLPVAVTLGAATAKGFVATSPWLAQVQAKIAAEDAERMRRAELDEELDEECP